MLFFYDEIEIISSVIDWQNALERDKTVEISVWAQYIL